jgi:hypothetical protein
MGRSTVAVIAAGIRGCMGHPAPRSRSPRAGPSAQDAAVRTGWPLRTWLLRWRNFDAYPLVAAVVNAEPVPVPLLPDGRQDLASLANLIDEHTRTVAVCNPHNPTERLVTSVQLTASLRRVPDHRGRVGRGVHRVRRAPPTCRTGPSYSTRTRTWWCSARSPEPKAPPRCGSATRSATLTWWRGYDDRRQQLPRCAGEELCSRVDTVIVDRERLRSALRAGGWSARARGFGSRSATDAPTTPYSRLWQVNATSRPAGRYQSCPQRRSL